MPTYSINTSEILHENIDGEIVMINLGTGSYFNLNHSGADVWGFIEAGYEFTQIVKALAARYKQADVEADVRRFLADLVKEGLVQERDANTPVSNGSAPQPASEPYAAPVLEVYTDIKDLLLLDPIHDTNERGWPHVGDDA